MLLPVYSRAVGLPRRGKSMPFARRQGLKTHICGFRNCIHALSAKTGRTLCKIREGGKGGSGEVMNGVQNEKGGGHRAAYRPARKDSVSSFI